MITVITKVVEGKVKGRFSFECSHCGYCGGNYPSLVEAKFYAAKHQELPHV